ncbi:MAG: calcium-binding protein, partial [Leptolyngbya sp. SIO4C5]|nr:calcium-binding protein [Leptolyngbya sp. SIO4C5]
YHVDSMGDRVIEALGEGLDQVLASTSHILSANVEDLILQGTALSGQGNSLNNVISGNDASNYIDAGDGDDFVFGNGGNDTLSGGSGNDLMFGGEGSDIYYVDSVGDRITEGIDQGLDQVYASVNHTLDANVENLTLQGNAVDGFGNGLNNTINGTSLNNYLFGDGGDDFLYGDGGDDYINGGLGDDFMLGGVGNDEYVVDSAGDFVVENSGQGLDQVYSYIDYVLGANVENLTLEETSTAVTGQGNSLDNVVNGNGFDNTLYGHEGNDSLYGYEGNDGLSGGTGDDYLLGGAGSDYLLAGDGNDTLLGGVGNDSLEGGLGADKFFFGSLGEGIDNIIDFTQDQSDKLLISASGFGSDLMAGLLDSSQFVLGSSATGANERFIYDQGTGALSFDADGSGSQAAVQFASFSPSTALSHNDFLMV